MSNDNLKNYLLLRDALTQEKAELEARLKEIDTALGIDYGYSARPRGRTPGHGNNAISLKRAVMRLTNGRALTKRQILDEVELLGYKFKTTNPLNSLSVILYGKVPKFNRENGAFILAPSQMPPEETSSPTAVTAATV